MIRTTTTRTGFRGRRHIEVLPSIKTGNWYLAWANPTQHGYHMEPPIETGFKTKREALERKRQLTASAT